jgi:hypothetical protein
MRPVNTLLKLTAAWQIFVIVAILSALSVPNFAAAQRLNGITEPTEEDPISGIIIISGTATDPNFMRYELAFKSPVHPDWIVFAQGDQPVIDGTLAVWDTTVGRETIPVFPDGVYQLRLRVVRTDYNYDEYFASRIVVSNDEPTPTPSPTVEEGAAGPAQGQTTEGTPQPTIGPLPTLTPFPTPLPRATPIESAAIADVGSSSNGEADNRGVFNQLTALDTSRFAPAFWRGALIVGFAFLALALYLIFRGAFRRAWRFIQSQLFK